MRALVWHGPGRMSVDELPEPEAGSGEVVLVPEAAGICGSDALLVDGRAGLGELEGVQPLEAGPEAFAELSARPSPRLKVFLAAEPT